MKNKITNGQYVDIDKLLINSSDPKKQTIVVVNGELQISEKHT